MACERIKKLLCEEISPSGSDTSSKYEKDDSGTTHGPATLTQPSSLIGSVGQSSIKLNDFQKKITAFYESRINQECAYKELHQLNPHLEKLDEDILYHIALGNKSHDLQKMFKDVKFIVMGGTPKRMEQFAYYIMKEIGHELQPGTILNDISKHSHRYALYKVGPIISVSHGMGMPSIGILLNELIKLVHHAGIVDPIFVRIGTCGGFAKKGGTVVITEEVVNDYLESVYELSILGTNIRFPAKLNRGIASDIANMASPQDNFETITGKTYCTDGFYEGSGRADGAICEFSKAEGLQFYHLMQKNGVVNAEMESLAFAAFTCRAGIKSAVISVVLSDRLEDDQIKQPREVLDEWQTRPQRLLARYIKKVLTSSSAPPDSRDITTDPVAAPKPIATATSTPGAKLLCPELAACKPHAQPLVTPTTTSQPPIGITARPISAQRPVCKPLCKTLPIAETTPFKTTPAAEPAKKETDTWRSCYRVCGIGSEQADVGTPIMALTETTTKPSVKSSTTPSFRECPCDRNRHARTPTPMPKPSCQVPSADISSTLGGTTVPPTLTGSTYKAKDFDSSTKSSVSDESRRAYYQECVKLPQCEFTEKRKADATFAAPIQEKMKEEDTAKSEETRPCCLKRGTSSLKTHSGQKQIDPLSKITTDTTTTRSKPPEIQLHKSLPQPVSDPHLVGPCCGGKTQLSSPESVDSFQLGPCCTGQATEGTSPDYAEKCELVEDVIHHDEQEIPIQRGTHQPDNDDDVSKGRLISTDCPLDLKSKCKPQTYAKDTFQSVKPSPETPDPRHLIKGPIFSTTPMPIFQRLGETGSTTPAATNQIPCCKMRLDSKSGGTQSSTASLSQKTSPSCCLPTPTGATNSSTFAPVVDSKSSTMSAGLDKLRRFGGMSTNSKMMISDANKYDESPSPCAACKKYQDSKIIFTGGTPSVSQPEIIKCPHKLKRLKEECEGYE